MSTRHSAALALIIDPDQASIHILRDHLRLTWGYEVHWSNTEDQAWALCRAQAENLQNAAVAAADYSLASAAKALKDHLDNAAQNRGFACREFVEGIDGVFNASKTSAPLKKRSILWIE
jgi:hypothetical protein